MIEKFDITKLNIPYGALHDQKLKSVKLENNKMIFTFDINIFEQNYYDKDFFNKYSGFSHCDMVVEMCEDAFNYYEFSTAVNKHSKIETICLNVNDFMDIINHYYESEFIDCYVSHHSFKIELCIKHYNAQRKYKKYDICNVELDAKNIIWNWY